MSKSSHITHKGLNENMQEITYDEAKYLRERGVHCPKTCRLKNKGRRRGKRFAPDDRNVQHLLEQYRKNIKVIETYGDV